MNTMTIPVSDLSGAALDWAVAKCEGRSPSHCEGIVRATAHPAFPDNSPMFGPELNYSSDWSLAGPIIERERIAIGEEYGEWFAHIKNDTYNGSHSGPAPLIAAMRCYVASKLGGTVDVPSELL